MRAAAREREESMRGYASSRRRIIIYGVFVEDRAVFAGLRVPVGEDDREFDELRAGPRERVDGPARPAAVLSNCCEDERVRRCVVAVAVLGLGCSAGGSGPRACCALNLAMSSMSGSCVSDM